MINIKSITNRCMNICRIIIYNKMGYIIINSCPISIFCVPIDSYCNIANWKIHTICHQIHTMCISCVYNNIFKFI